MALLWFNLGLSDETRAKLIELFYELGGDKFVWPKDEYAPWKIQGKIIDEEEIDRLREIDREMRKPTKFRRPPG